ncbi:MAG: hypothetical protein EAX89_15820 [Candidatus Lokiarchaeota archaeon]|nr:hypothetical protein [Candidatus Lokiarchaeota archaeon]
MTEIKKFTKIVLLVDAILWFLFGILLTFLYDMTMNPEGWTNPYLPRMFGGVNLISAIFALLMLRKNEWEEIKLTFEYFIGILISTLIIEVAVYATFYSTFGVSWRLQGLFPITVEAVLLLLGILCYIKQRS